MYFGRGPATGDDEKKLCVLSAFVSVVPAGLLLSQNADPGLTPGATHCSAATRLAVLRMLFLFRLQSSAFIRTVIRIGLRLHLAVMHTWSIQLWTGLVAHQWRQIALPVTLFCPPCGTSPFLKRRPRAYALGYPLFCRYAAGARPRAYARGYPLFRRYAAGARPRAYARGLPIIPPLRGWGATRAYARGHPLFCRYAAGGATPGSRPGHSIPPLPG